MRKEPVVHIKEEYPYSKNIKQERVSQFVLNPPGANYIDTSNKVKFANLCSILVSKGILDAQDLLQIVGLKGFYYDLEIEQEEEEK